ncbi:deoxyribodipyrimidine photolyase [Taibaiella sp. KBW10]|uniref:cryptochrome/photolyase family protein n=1 Tax=Taibaiella sp. KBW10 TaxID=2153357 RepID=UPI000F5AED42|nr:deoxyribodipyrimidine photo-lyase [Taibaiella sp. KBW10]RQO30115.1 deoxyribodipyrimidine photolyase [Taibaiella sp. KBW10]
MQTITIFWHRRDLRLEDNAGLYYALRHHKNVLPIFIFDRNILEALEDKTDARVSFIHESVCALSEQYKQWHSGIETFYDTPLAVLERLQQEYHIEAVYTNEDYEPYAQRRDTQVKEWCLRNKIIFQQYKDQVVFAKAEVVKSDGSPYTIFTPYSKAWKKKLNPFYLKPYPVTKYCAQLYRTERAKEVFPLADMGFKPTPITLPGTKITVSQIQAYEATRNFPFLDQSTTLLGIHLRFGTLSIRKLVQHVQAISETFLNELIWREFFQTILWHFPKVVHQSFKPQYDHIVWRNNETEFNLWCTGKTGYPLVDAGMRELNATGHMHNRVRMLVASFLVKDLLIDWRWGEAYFATKLLDYELAANNGNWQWAAGCGCDAAPYFRVFNPALQQQKFDPDFIYIKKWVPEYGTKAYSEPIVDHAKAKDRCIKAFKEALQK